MTLAEVYLWGTRIGTVAYDDRTRLGSFQYDEAFLSSGIEVAPVTMPLASGVYQFPELSGSTFHGLPGLLSDSLPDKFGNAVINAWLQSQGRAPDSFDPVERLCYIGARGMGALEYRPALGPSFSKTEQVHLDRLVQLASDVLKSRKDMHVSFGPDAMHEILRVSTSAGGARAKAVIALNQETGDIRSGQIDAGDGYEYWLIKFDGVDGNGDKEGADAPQYTRIEYAYYQMARSAGIMMSPSRLHEENGRCHFMTRRFDRDAATGEKIHMLSLGGMAHYDFNLPHVYGYEQATKVMRRIHLLPDDLEQFYIRMVFNVMARNQDDHVKNISFLMNRSGQWKLAPAYDVTYAFNPDGRWTGTHQMTVNGKSDHITRQDLLASAANMDIRKSKAEQMIEQVSRSLVRWPEFAENVGLNEHTANSIFRQFIL